MKIGILGTGTVGRALGTGFLRLGHEARLGSRTADNANSTAWAAESGGGAPGTFEDVASWADVVVNATNGLASVEVITGVGSAVDGKVVIDASNPLDFSHGFPPTLSVANNDSLGEQIQRAAPQARVVKALNTLTADLMLNPQDLPSPTDLFMAGEDAAAKADVGTLLTSAGWTPDNIHDLGGIEAARGMEMWLPLWLRLMGSVGSGGFNIHVVRQP